MRGLVGAFAIALAGGWACGSAGAFDCTDDAQCVAGGEQGRCEATGYCSFGDSDCPSMQRYGDRAPTGLAGQCTRVDETDSGSTDGGVGPGTSPATSTPPGSDSEDEPPGTTIALDDGTTLDPTRPGTDATSDAASSSSEAGTDESTTAAEPECEPYFVDDFADGVVDPQWDTWADTACDFQESDGHVQFLIGTPGDGSWVGSGLYVGPASIVGGHVRAEFPAFEGPPSTIGVWVSAWDANDCEIDIAVEDGTVFSYDDADQYTAVPFTPDAPFWLQIRVDTDAVAYFEWSLDGTSWMLLGTSVSGCDLDNVRTAVFAGGHNELVTPIVREVESFERCALPP